MKSRFTTMDVKVQKWAILGKIKKLSLLSCVFKLVYKQNLRKLSSRYLNKAYASYKLVKHLYAIMLHRFKCSNFSGNRF